MEHWLATIPPLAIAAVVFGIVALESLGLPLPGETILVSGVLVSVGGQHDPWLVAVAGALGAMLGDNIGYGIGHRFGDRVFALGRARMPQLFSEERVAHATALMRRRGVVAVFFGRFIALLRIFAGPLAGSLHLPFWRFFVANALGAAVWAGSVTALVWGLGAPAERIIRASSWVALAIVAVLLLVAGVLAAHRAGFGWARSIGRVAARVGRLIARLPATTAFLVLYFGLGIVFQALSRPLEHRPWMPGVAYGIPSFSEGRWWTVLTGTFFSMQPLHYAFMAFFAIAAMGWLEWRRGWRFTAVAYIAGQIYAVIGAAAIIDACSLIPQWEWAQRLADSPDVGPSGGLAVCLAFAIATLPAPWRFRLRVLYGAALLVPLLFIGSIADLEHFVGGFTIVLFGFGSRGRQSVRDWRIVAFVGAVLIGVIQLVVSFVPTGGPFGKTDPGEIVWWDVLIDVVIVAVIALGLLRGRTVAWWIAICAAGFNVLEAVAALSLLDEWADDLPGLEIGLAASTLWLVLGVLLIVGRRAFSSPLRRSRLGISSASEAARDRAIGFLKRYGGGTLSWMITWPLMRQAFGRAGDWALGVRRVSGVAIALGDPIVAAGGEGPAIAEFIERCERVDVVPCFFSASETTRAAVPAEWRSLRVADDSIVDLPGLEFTGKAWNASRTAINRAAREGISFRLARLAEQPWSIRTQVRAISEEWVGDKGLPEMGFTLGGVEEAMDPEVRVALALDGDGSVHGVLSWLPVYGPEGPGAEPVIRGWTLDVMRRRDGGFGPVIEYLISESLLAFRDEGAQYASLSGAPLANEPGEDDGPIQRLLSMLGGMLEPLYGFRSLHRFKQKFNPREEPLYLLYRDEGDLPKIGVALTRAFLPHASALDLARAGAALAKH